MAHSPCLGGVQIDSIPQKKVIKPIGTGPPKMNKVEQRKVRGFIWYNHILFVTFTFYSSMFDRTAGVAAQIPSPEAVQVGVRFLPDGAAATTVQGEPQDGIPGMCFADWEKVARAATRSTPEVRAWWTGKGGPAVFERCRDGRVSFTFSLRSQLFPILMHLLGLWAAHQI